MITNINAAMNVVSGFALLNPTTNIPSASNAAPAQLYHIPISQSQARG